MRGQDAGPCRKAVAVCDAARSTRFHFAITSTTSAFSSTKIDTEHTGARKTVLLLVELATYLSALINYTSLGPPSQPYQEH